jgi:putative endonuclease
MTSRRNGMRYEDQARRYLEAKGLVSLQHNYQSRFGEIDLVMRDEKTICFIEVKFRRSTAFGGAAYSITQSKQQKLIKTSLYFLLENKNLRQCAFRFDALLIQQHQNSEEINWIKNAFYAE